MSREEGSTRFVVLNPTQGVTGKGVVAPPLATLAGKRICFLWNSKSNGDVVAGMLLELLSQRHQLGGILIRAKPYLGNIASPEILDELASKCDAVITGVGD